MVIASQVNGSATPSLNNGQSDSQKKPQRNSMPAGSGILIPAKKSLTPSHQSSDQYQKLRSLNQTLPSAMAYGVQMTVSRMKKDSAQTCVSLTGRLGQRSSTPCSCPASWLISFHAKTVLACSTAAVE